MTNYSTTCEKKWKGRKSVTSEFVSFEGVKLFALFAVIKFLRRSKTAINYGCKGIGFERAAGADMSFFGGGVHEFSSDYLSCKRRAVENIPTGPLCCCPRAGIHRASVWAALHPHCPKAVFLIVLMRERCSVLHCRDAAYTPEQPYLHCTYTNLTALIKEQKIKPPKASIDQP